jgi:hypothetical protein
MANPKMRLEVSFNETTGEPLAAYLRIREGKVVQTKEITADIAFADVAEDGSLPGIDLLTPCQAEVLACSRRARTSFYRNRCLRWS